MFAERPTCHADAVRAADDARSPRIGLIINPVAGIGGPVALKGSDGAAALAEARRRGGTPRAAARADRALAALARRLPGCRVLAGGGPLGADAARRAGFATDAVTEAPVVDDGWPDGIGPDETAVIETTAADTRQAAAEILRARPELILFAGGDGTARDVFAVVGDDMPMLGIPAGVKMHSAVFARTPEAAGEAAARFLAGVAGPSGRSDDAEIMDIDEDAVRAGRASARLYGYARSPRLAGFVQNAKAAPALGDDAALAAACAEVARNLAADRPTLFGPGTTTRRVMRALGLDGTLLGVDAVKHGRVIGSDLTERQILRLLDEEQAPGQGSRDPVPATIVIGVIGGQGCLFGRGNQQLGPAVVRRVGRDNIVVVAASEKLAALGTAGFFVDTGDPQLDALLAGYMRVHTGPGMTSIVRIAAAEVTGGGAAAENQTAA